MPSEKVLLKKQAAVEELVQKLQNSVAGVLIDYKGINVDKDTKMRRELRMGGVEYSVIKNSILRRACEKVGFEGLNEALAGTTALAISDSDPVAAAKILSKYVKEGRDKFNVKAGFVEGRILDAAAVEELAKLPSREELIARTLGGFNAPITGFVNVLNGNLRGLVVALNAIAELKQSA